MLRPIVLSFAVPMLAALVLSAEGAGDGPLDEIHRAFDSGALEPLQAARRYSIAARRHRADEPLASEAFFFAGVAYERLGRFRNASEAYLAVVLYYPGSVWFMPAVDALMKTGERLFEEARRGGAALDIRMASDVFEALSGIGLPGEDTAAAVYRRGVCSLMRRRWLEAELDFRRVLEDYPFEPWREKAYFKLGRVYAGRILRPTRDQSGTVKAIAHFNSFLDNYPGGPLAQKARTELIALKERKAEHLFRLCEFYRRSSNPQALDFYLGILTRDYPGTSWAALASEQFEL